MKYATMLTAVLAVILMLTATGAYGTVPHMISYQGRLTDDSGTLLDTTVSLTFTIYDDSTGGNVKWNENQPSVTVVNGLFNVLLGTIVPLEDSVFSSPERYLAIQVGVDPEIVPRTKLTSVAYSYHALQSDTAGFAMSIIDDAVTSAKIQDGAVLFDDFGQNGAIDGQVVKWNGSAWVAADDEAGSGSNGWVDDGTVIRLETITDYVGIGTPTPTEKLHVAGGVKIDHTLFVGGLVGIGTASPSAGLHVLTTAVTPAGYFQIDNVGNDTCALFAETNGNGYAVYGKNGYDLGCLGGSNRGLYGHHGSGYGYGVFGETSDSGPNSYGVYGRHDSSNNLGFFGTSLYGACGYNSNGNNYGYLGTENQAVYGKHRIDITTLTSGHLAGNDYGAYGKHHGGSNYGYLGGDDCGAYGKHEASGNYGLIADSSSGLYGHHSSGYGYGVHGKTSEDIFDSYGVYGIHESSNNYGSIGSTTSGLRGHHDNGFGYGVYGETAEGASSSYGVYGIHENSNNLGFLGNSLYGACGYNSSGNNYGYLGTTGQAVYGKHLIDITTVTFGYLGSSDYGAYGKHESSGNSGFLGSNQCGVYGFSFSNYAGYFDGRVYMSSDLGIGTLIPLYELDVNGDIGCVQLHESSDKRLKTNVVQLTNVLEKIDKIRGVSFEWNKLAETVGASMGEREIGVLAQDVELVFPELVSTPGDGYKSVNYTKLSAVLIEAVKELNKKTKKIERLEGEMTELRAMLKKLLLERQ